MSFFFLQPLILTNSLSIMTNWGKVSYVGKAFIIILLSCRSNYKEMGRGSSVGGKKKKKLFTFLKLVR